MPQPHFTPGKDPVPNLQEAGWAPGPVWMGVKSRSHRDLIPDRPARSQSLYRLSYPAHNSKEYDKEIYSTDGKLYENVFFKLTTNIMPSILIQRPRLEVALQS